MTNDISSDKRMIFFGLGYNFYPLIDFAMTNISFLDSILLLAFFLYVISRFCERFFNDYKNTKNTKHTTNTFFFFFEKKFFYHNALYKIRMN
jgi:hypothetical protein